MLRYKCEILPAWRVRLAAEQMTGLPVGMPSGHLALDAATWLDMFLAADAAGIREVVKDAEELDRNELVVAYLADNPDSTEREIRDDLIAEYGIHDAHLGGFLNRLQKQGRIHATGERASRHTPTSNTHLWGTTWALTEEVTG